MPKKNGNKNGRMMSFEEVVETMTYLIEQDKLHEKRFAQMEARMDQSSREFDKRMEAWEKRQAIIEQRQEQNEKKQEERWARNDKESRERWAQYEKEVKERWAQYEKEVKERDRKYEERVKKAEERFEKQFRRLMALSAQMTKTVAEQQAELQEAQLQSIRRMAALEDEMKELTANVNRFLRGQSRHKKNGHN